MALQAMFLADDNHFARFDFADKFGTYNIKSTGFGAKRPAITNLSQD
jgi:hypothetical protein